MDSSSPKIKLPPIPPTWKQSKTGLHPILYARYEVLGKSPLCPWAGIRPPRVCTPFLTFIYMYRGLAVTTHDSSPTFWCCLHSLPPRVLSICSPHRTQSTSTSIRAAVPCGGCLQERRSCRVQAVERGRRLHIQAWHANRAAI